MSLQQCYSPLHDNNDTINGNGIMLADVEEEVLLFTTSLEQCYFPFHNNDFRNNDNPIDYIGNTKAYNICMESYNNATIISIVELIIESVSHSDNPINDEDEGQYDIPINSINNSLFLQWPVIEGG